MSDISFEGLEQILARLKKVSDTGNIEEAMGQACALVERSAKQKAPKDTGALRRSITSRVESKGDSVEGVVYTPLEYAPYVEYGTGLYAENGGRKDVPWFFKDDEGVGHLTSGNKPNPYLRPALKENRAKIVDLLKGGLNND